MVLLMLTPALSIARTLSMPLKDAAQVQTVKLSGISSNTDQYDFKLSIPERWEVAQARITFAFTNSSALIKARSKLVFYFDDTPVTQATLDPLSTQNTISAIIPAHLLQPGYHSFSFEVSQHSVADGCEDPSAPELWTVIELNDAILEIDYELEPVPLRISAVSDFLFDPRHPEAPPVDLIYKNLDPDIMKAVSMVAAGIAVRYDYRGPRFFSSPYIQKNMDTILIGHPDEIRSLLEPFKIPDMLTSVTGPWLSIHHLPVYPAPAEPSLPLPPDRQHFLILVTGTTPSEIITASQALSLISMPLPDTQTLQIQDIQVPPLPEDTHKNSLSPGYRYSFASLNFPSVTFSGMNPVPKGFGFWIPSDSHLTPNLQAVLSLNMAYGAAMREDSVLNILLNDKFVAAIPCNDPQGGTYQSYNVRLRMSSMKRGFNKLSFSPQLTPLVTDQCNLIQTGNLKVTLFANSTFTLPEMDQWIEMPSLTAFLTDGFPFGRYPDMRDTRVLVPDKSRASFLTAVNLLALAAQKTGFPPLNIEWSLDAELTPEKDIIIVSTPDAVPDDFQDAAPLSLKSPGPLRYPHLSRAKGQTDTQSDGFFSTLFRQPQPRVTNIAVRQSELVMVTAVPLLAKGRAALMEFQNPLNRNRTILALITSSDEDMQNTPAFLWKSEFQAALNGDTTLINLGSPKVETFSAQLGKRYYLGEVSSVPFIDYYANTYPLWFIGSVLAICMVIVFILYKFLKRRKQRRFPDE